MNATRRAALEAAFLDTCYRVDTPAGAFALRIGQPNDAFDAWLAAQDAARWAVLTACNPAAKPLPDEANAARQAALRDEIGAAGWRFFPACNLPDADDWPAEAAFLLLDADESALRELAGAFGQLAFVAGERRGAARLIWLV